MKQILVVEDEDILRDNIIEILDFRGYDIKSAVNGDEALTLLNVYKPDVIISDIMMPVCDGYELLNRVQQIPSLSKIPFIFLTARIDKTEMRKGMNLGADDYLTKPFLATELIDAIESRIKKAKKQSSEIDQIKNNILMYVPHELRTPLVSILGVSDLLEKNFHNLSQNEIMEMTQLLKSAGTRLQKRIEKFLTLVGQTTEDEIDMGNFPTENADKVIEKTAFEMAANKNRAEDTTVEAIPATLAIPENNLKIVLAEILENSYKFSPVGSKVKVSTTNGDKFYSIKITDYGEGLNQEDIMNLDDYNQINRNEKQQEGNGLGLAIVRQILSRFSGKMNIKSQKGKSTTVELEIPILTI